MFKKLFHYLFKCPTFWQLRPAFECPSCGKGYRCYWDGNDVPGHGIDICNSCTADIEDLHSSVSGHDHENF